MKQVIHFFSPTATLLSPSYDVAQEKTELYGGLFSLLWVVFFVLKPYSCNASSCGGR